MRCPARANLFPLKGWWLCPVLGNNTSSRSGAISKRLHTKAEKNDSRVCGPAAITRGQHTKRNLDNQLCKDVHTGDKLATKICVLFVHGASSPWIRTGMHLSGRLLIAAFQGWVRNHGCASAFRQYSDSLSVPNLRLNSGSSHSQREWATSWGTKTAASPATIFSRWSWISVSNKYGSKCPVSSNFWQ